MRCAVHGTARTAPIPRHPLCAQRHADAASRLFSFAEKQRGAVPAVYKRGVRRLWRSAGARLVKRQAVRCYASSAQAEHRVLSECARAQQARGSVMR